MHLIIFLWSSEINVKLWSNHFSLNPAWKFSICSWKFCFLIFLSMLEIDAVQWKIMSYSYTAHYANLCTNCNNFAFTWSFFLLMWNLNIFNGILMNLIKFSYASKGFDALPSFTGSVENCILTLSYLWWTDNIDSFFIYFFFLINIF